MKIITLFLVLVTLCFAVNLGQAYNYLPIDPADPNSDHWYVCLNDGSLVHRYAGEMAAGYRTHHIVASVDEFELYHTVWLLSHEDDGTVILRGASFDGGVTYPWLDLEYPLIMPPLSVGQTWSYETPGLISTLECLAEEDLKFCDEVYHAFLIRRIEDDGEGTFFVANEWYSDGFGCVKFNWIGEDYELICPIAVDRAHWSSVKALFR